MLHESDNNPNSINENIWEQLKNVNFRSQVMNVADKINYFSEEQRKFLMASLDIMLQTVTPNNFLTGPEYLCKLDEILKNPENHCHLAIKKLAQHNDFERFFKINYDVKFEKQLYFFDLVEEEKTLIQKKLDSHENENRLSMKNLTNLNFFANSSKGVKLYETDIYRLKTALTEAYDSYLKQNNEKTITEHFQQVSYLMDLVEETTDFSEATYNIKRFLEDNANEPSFSTIVRSELEAIYDELVSSNQKTFKFLLGISSPSQPGLTG